MKIKKIYQETNKNWKMSKNVKKKKKRKKEKKCYSLSFAI